MNNREWFAIMWIILFAAIVLSIAWGRASQRAEYEDFDVVRIHRSYREIDHYKYCPYCGKELNNADSN